MFPIKFLPLTYSGLELRYRRYTLRITFLHLRPQLPNAPRALRRVQDSRKVVFETSRLLLDSFALEKRVTLVASIHTAHQAILKPPLQITSQTLILALLLDCSTIVS
jgi:hypothetical protein